MGDDELALGDPVEIPGVGVLLHQFVVAVLRLRVAIREEPALGELPERVFFDHRVGPAVDGSLIFGDRLRVFAVSKQAVTFRQRLPRGRLVGAAAEDFFPTLLDVVTLEIIPAKLLLDGTEFGRDHRRVGVGTQRPIDLLFGGGGSLRPGPGRCLERRASGLHDEADERGRAEAMAGRMDKRMCGDRWHGSRGSRYVGRIE